MTGPARFRATQEWVRYVYNECGWGQGKRRTPQPTTCHGQTQMPASRLSWHSPRWHIAGALVVRWSANNSLPLCVDPVAKSCKLKLATADANPASDRLIAPASRGHSMIARWTSVARGTFLRRSTIPPTRCTDDHSPSICESVRTRRGAGSLTSSFDPDRRGKSQPAHARSTQRPGGYRSPTQEFRGHSAEGRLESFQWLRSQTSRGRSECQGRRVQFLYVHSRPLRLFLEFTSDPRFERVAGLPSRRLGLPLPTLGRNDYFWM